MKSVFKIIIAVLAFLVLIPACAGIIVTVLWNALIPAICGFTSITFLQGIGLFYLGMFLTVGAFYLGMFLMGIGMHSMRAQRSAWHNHWHNMTDEERREFIKNRREHFSFRNRQNSADNANE